MTREGRHGRQLGHSQTVSRNLLDCVRRTQTLTADVNDKWKPIWVQEKYMKLVATISRYLLAILFTAFGLNGFLHVIPQPPLQEQVAKQFLAILASTHYIVPVFGLQLIAGLLLFTRRFTPLALALLSPVIVNILFFHLFMSPEGIGPGALAALLWAIVFIPVRKSFTALFDGPSVPLA